MGISLVRESPAARRLAASVLTERLPKDFDTVRTPGVLAVLPLYAIPSEHMISGDFHHSWRWGWRYFWGHAKLDEGAIVDVRRTSGGRTKLQRYTTGRWVQRVTEVMAAASERYSSAAERYRPRIIRLPEIHMEAFWLSPANRTDRHHFASLIDDREDDAFLAEARARLRSIPR